MQKKKRVQHKPDRQVQVVRAAPVEKLGEKPAMR